MSYRDVCRRCRKARVTCYCHLLRPFEAPVGFVILQHLDEARNAIATARMAHLSITNSRLVTGNHFEHDAAVDGLLADGSVRNLMLYPGPAARPLGEVLEDEDPRPPVFWAIDAKWAQVNKMLRLSPNVKALPMVTFEHDQESLFTTIRSQPKKQCLSTLEAIHVVIEQVKRARGDTGREHDALLDVFRHLVRQQLEYVTVDNRRHESAKALRRMRREAKGLPPHV